MTIRNRLNQVRAVCFAVGLFLGVTSSGEAQWQPEQIIASTSRPDPEGSCGRFPSSTATVCIYEEGANFGGMNLFEKVSWDGGVTWSSASQVTFDAGKDEFDPFIAVDSGRGRLWLLYSRNRTGGGNELLIRYKGCSTCPWTSPTTVISDSGNHWDASLLVVNNGHLLALETIESAEGALDGQIRSIRSTDGGFSWGAPSVIFDEPGVPETYPVALQKSDGFIHLMFRDKAHGGGNQIGQLWSNDGGYTWTGHSVFSFNSSQPREFSFIGTQGSTNITVLATISGRVHHWQSSNNGVSFAGPFQTTSTTSTADAEFTVGCRGAIFTYTAPNGFRERRFDWYSSCQ